MKRIDKISKVFNLILGVIYIPLSFFSWLMQMASEMTIDATNPLFINLVNIFCVVSFFIPILCVVGIVLSAIFRKKGHSISSIIFQFLPLVIFMLNLLLLFCTDFIPHNI